MAVGRGVKNANDLLLATITWDIFCGRQGEGSMSFLYLRVTAQANISNNYFHGFMSGDISFN